MIDKHKIMLTISHELNERLTQEKLATGADKLEIIRVALRNHLGFKEERIDYRVKGSKPQPIVVMSKQHRYGPEGEILD